MEDGMPVRVKKDRILDIVEPEVFKMGQEVDLIIKDKTHLGYKAIINQQYWGVLYSNEVYTNLSKDQTTKGYIKKIREDGRIDLSLYPLGHKVQKEFSEVILDYLTGNNGFYAYTAKTEPDEIYDLFGLSKKKFKIVIGGLYKARKIDIRNDGIYLVK